MGFEGNKEIKDKRTKYKTYKIKTKYVFNHHNNLQLNSDFIRNDKTNIMG